MMIFRGDRWGLWRSPFGGFIARCPWAQLTVRGPHSPGLYSDRSHRAVFGYRFILRSFRGTP